MQDRKEQAKAEVAALVDKFHSERRRDQSEADVRAGYIDQLFFALGWNIHNDPGKQTNYWREGYIRGAGFVDIGMEIGGQPVLFLEAKRFGIIPETSKRTGDRTTEEKQAFRYSRGRRIPYAILTNFERLQLFNADHERLVGAFDSPEEYLERFEELWRLTPEEVGGGSLGWWEGQLEKKDVDLEFLKSLRAWRLTLASAIFAHNANSPELQRDGTFDFGKLMEAVQRILDRLILMRYGDDKEVLLVHDLLENALDNYRKRGAYASSDHLMRDFIELSHQMDDQHNTTLFQAGHPCEKVTIPNEVLAMVIDELSRISFRKFTSDILGNTYESYLGTKLKLVNGQIVDEERTDIRKGKGIYYTPSWVVNYIVDKTLGESLRRLEQEHGLHAIEKVRGLAVLDPACGSGSFLIRAYHVLADFYRRMNQGIIQEQTKLAEGFASADMFERLERLSHLPQQVVDYPQVILQEHLYGVDLDPEAAEIATVNLTMQAFADSRQKKLPKILDENIKVGNSLISGTEEELRPYFGQAWAEKRPFNWAEEFPAVMERGGFDVVVGNPPYVRVQNIDQTERQYFKAHYQSATGHFDTSVLFLEKNVSCSRKTGVVGVITTGKFLKSMYGRGIKDYMYERAHLSEVIDLSDLKVFGDATTYPAIIIVEHSDTKTPIIILASSSTQTNDEPELFAEKGRLSYETLLTNVWAVGEQITSTSPIEALGKVAGRIFVGPQTDSDAIFILRGALVGDTVRVFSKATGKWHVLERGAVMPLLQGEDVRRYVVPEPHNWIIFPYRRLEAKVTLLLEEDMARNYPLCFEYLLQNKAVLRGRPRLSQPATRWYAFGQQKNLALQFSPKICVPRLCTRLGFTFDDQGIYCQDNVDVCGIALPDESRYSFHYLLGILNSRLLDHHFQIISAPFQGGYRSANRQFLEPLPIRRIDFGNATDKALHDGLVALVERMLDLQKRIQPLRGTGLTEEQDVLAEIGRTDREIDDVVYDLYGLTEGERRLVEGEGSP